MRRARGPSGAFPGAPGLPSECDPIPTLLRPQTQLVAQAFLGCHFSSLGGDFSSLEQHFSSLEGDFSGALTFECPERLRTYRHECLRKQPRKPLATGVIPE